MCQLNHLKTHLMLSLKDKRTHLMLSLKDKQIHSMLSLKDMLSEEARPVEVTAQDIEDRGFYTETFHCASWIYRGDDASPSESPRCLSKRTKPVTSKSPSSSLLMSFPVHFSPWIFLLKSKKKKIIRFIIFDKADLFLCCSS